MVQGEVQLVASNGQAIVNILAGDDVIFAIGDDDDIVFMHRSSALAADAEITSVIVGTSDHQGVAADSLILSNITEDGDIIMLVNDGGNSKEFLLVNAAIADLQLGHGMATINLRTASGDIRLNASGNIVLDSGAFILVGDNLKLALGANADIVLVNRTTSLAADTELTTVIEGTSNHQGVVANSLILSNITDDGDIMMLVSDGGNSLEMLKFTAATAEASFGWGALKIGFGPDLAAITRPSGVAANAAAIITELINLGLFTA